MKQTRVPARIPDWHNLPKPTWREALSALAGPAARLHRYRNLREHLFDSHDQEWDCRNRS